MLLDLKTILFVEFESLLVIALDVEDHAGDIAWKHAVLDSLLQKLRSNAIPSVRLKHRDSHDVALLGAIFQDVFLARDGADKDILDVGEFRVALHRFEHVVEVLRVDDWKSQIIQDTHLFEVLRSELAKSNV